MENYRQSNNLGMQLLQLFIIVWSLFVSYQIARNILGGSWVETTLLTALVIANITMSFGVIIQLGNMKGEIGNLRGDFHESIASVRTEVSKLSERIARIEVKKI